MTLYAVVRVRLASGEHLVMSRPWERARHPARADYQRVADLGGFALGTGLLTAVGYLSRDLNGAGAVTAITPFRARKK